MRYAVAGPRAMMIHFRYAPRDPIRPIVEWSVIATWLPLADFAVMGSGRFNVLTLPAPSLFASRNMVGKESRRVR